MEEKTIKNSDYSHLINKLSKPLSPYLFYICLSVILLVLLTNIVISIVNFQHATRYLEQLAQTEGHQQDIQAGIDSALMVIISGIVGSIVVLIATVLMVKEICVEKNRAVLDFEKLIDELTLQSQQLKEVHDELEERVRQRTNALLKSNQQLLTEILEHKKDRDKITSRLRYEHGLADFAKCLLSGFKSSQVMDNALKQLLKAMQVSRVFLNEVVYEEDKAVRIRSISQASIVCVDSKEQLLSKPHIDCHDVFAHWKDDLAAGRSVKANIEDLTDTERKVFEKVGIVSTLLLPIHINGKWYGAIGFDDASDQRQWSQEDISLLRTAADLVTIYLSKIQTLGELIAYQDKLRSLATKLTQTEERERHRIAEGLHDEIIQPMIFIKIKLEMIRRQAADSELEKSCVDMMKVIDKLTEDTRQFTFELSCPVLHEVGLEAALEEFMSSEVCEKHGVLTEFEHADEPIDIDHDMSVFLYKSARELLTNMVKHADASTVKVSLGRKNGSILLTVQDDGVGFDMHEGPVDVNRPSGFGLFSIRERLSCFGGNLKIESTPGQGTRAIMTAPIKPEFSSVGE